MYCSLCHGSQLPGCSFAARLSLCGANACWLLCSVARVALCCQGRASAMEGVLALSVGTVAVRECLSCAVCQKRSLMPIKAYSSMK